MSDKKILIVGGGLSGLIAALHLARNGVHAILIERKQYPFHRVCGEYISNEVIPYLESLDAFPSELRPASIRSFQLTSVSGRSATLPLDLGGFGISRYRLDHYLYEKARNAGVTFRLGTEATDIRFQKDGFEVTLPDEILCADMVLGAFGKRSRLDHNLHREFLQSRSPYTAVKYHLQLEGFPEDRIALHNFKGGYCGISHVEPPLLNLCYLTHRDHLRTYRDIRRMEEAVLFQNPHLRDIFSRATFEGERQVINEISFAPKSPVEHHVLMAGDAAGMIAPLCGNGMAMAIHAGKMAAEHMLRFHSGDLSRDQMEFAYSRAWRHQFGARLWAGRLIQKLFGSGTSSGFAVGMAQASPGMARWLMRHTHGQTF